MDLVDEVTIITDFLHLDLDLSSISAGKFTLIPH